MRITFLSTYPTAVPRHGGQHRVANMIAVLREAGHQVTSVGVLGSADYPSCQGFLPFPGYDVLNTHIENAFLMEDWAIGRWVRDDKVAHRRLASLIPANTDTIFSEHPWLFAFALRYQAEHSSRRLQLVYGSHNVECELKREIVEAYYDAKKAAVCADLVYDVEVEAIAAATMLTAVSSKDADWMSRFTSRPIIVAPNGVRPDRASIADVQEANGLSGRHKFALYVASGHPPNVFGFYDIFGAGLGALAPGEKLVVAGAAGQAIREDKRFGKVGGLERCFIDAGQVSEGALRGLLQTAHCLCLPMTSGGGTNLKTAEALWTGRPVVATPTAMRGFERYITASGVHTCGKPAEFLAALRTCMIAPREEIDAKERNARRSLLWTETLRVVAEALRSKELVHD